MNLAYVAGFFDGEGCVSFCRVRSSFYPRVLITNTDLYVLKEIQNKFGGDIRKLVGRKKNWKQCYMLRICWSSAVDFLDKISPYLRIKDRQAHTVFAWAAIKPGRGKHSAEVQESYQAVMEMLCDRMKWLNKRGVNNDPDPIDAIARGELS